METNSGKVKKLVTTLLPKEKYVLHHKKLQLYGKTCENLRKRADIKLVNNEATLKRMTSRPKFIGSKIFSKDLVAVHRVKRRLVLLNKPSYVGCAVLDLSKTLMYDFHYNWVRKKYGDKAKLLFTDTDSLTYHIRTKNVYEDMWKDCELFDFSDYPKESKYFSAENKKVIGKMKDECAGVAMYEFVGLRSKMYSYVKAGGGDKKAKGIKKEWSRKTSLTKTSLTLSKKKSK